MVSKFWQPMFKGETAGLWNEQDEKPRRRFRLHLLDCQMSLSSLRFCARAASHTDARGPAREGHWTSGVSRFKESGDTDAMECSSGS